MEARSAFRVYGNFIKDRGLPTAALPDTYLQMIAAWEQDQIKDTFYEYNIDMLRADLPGWQKTGRYNVCKAIYELIVEKDR